MFPLGGQARSVWRWGPHVFWWRSVGRTWATRSRWLVHPRKIRWSRRRLELSQPPITRAAPDGEFSFLEISFSLTPFGARNVFCFRGRFCQRAVKAHQIRHFSSRTHPTHFFGHVVRGLF